MIMLYSVGDQLIYNRKKYKYWKLPDVFFTMSLGNIHKKFTVHVSKVK